MVMNISVQDIRESRTRIQDFVKNTPLVWSEHFSAWFKLETQQPTASFKVRPAFNSILTNLNQAKSRGVIASSSGNFAQAVAYAARKLGIQATIVMPSITSPYKIERTRAWGADVVICGPSFEERWGTTHRLQKETGRLLVHPYDSPETICGDGTLGLELLEQLSGDFCVVVPTSGGGLLSGVAVAIKNQRPTCRVIGVQSKANGSMARSLSQGAPVNVGAVKSIADALVASEPGKNTFELVRKYVDDVVLVDEDEIKRAVRDLAFEQKLVVEPGGAVGVAALMAQGRIQSEGLPRVVILSGGNVQPEALNVLLKF